MKSRAQAVVIGGGNVAHRSLPMPLGRVTSGAYGYFVEKSLALCYLKEVPDDAMVKVMILGEPHQGRVLDKAPFDPNGERLRA